MRNNYKASIIYIFLLCPFLIQAQICVLDNNIYDQGNPGSNLIISDQTVNGVQSAQFLNDNFTIASSEMINSVCVLGAFRDENNVLRGKTSRDNNCNVTNPIVVVEYYSDNVGLPGSMIHSFSVPATIGAPDINRQCVISANHPVITLASGTYWVSIYGDQISCDLYLVYNGQNGIVRNTPNERMMPDGFYRSSDKQTWTLQPTTNSGLNFSLGALNLAPIPTLSEWGIIILILGFMIIGVVFFTSKNQQLNNLTSALTR